MSIPSIKNATAIAAVMGDEGVTIACQKCKTPLWKIKITGRYGSKITADKTPFPGVPPYEDFWEKDQKTAKRTDCPHCGKDYLGALIADGHVFAKPYILEFGE